MLNAVHSMDQPRSFLLGAGNKAPLFYSHVHGRSGSRAISNSQCRRRTTSSALFSECKPTPRGWCFSRHSKGAEAAGKGSCFLLKSPPNNCSSNPASPILLFPLADPNLSQQEAQRRCRPSPPLPRLPTVAARICPRRRPLPPPGRGPSSCLPLSYRPLRAASLSPRGGGRRVPELAPPAGPPPAPFFHCKTTRRLVLFAPLQRGAERMLPPVARACFYASVLESLPPLPQQLRRRAIIAARKE